MKRARNWRLGKNFSVTIQKTRFYSRTETTTEFSIHKSSDGLVWPLQKDQESTWYLIHANRDNCHKGAANSVKYQKKQKDYFLGKASTGSGKPWFHSLAKPVSKQESRWLESSMSQEKINSSSSSQKWNIGKSNFIISIHFRVLILHKLVHGWMKPASTSRDDAYTLTHCVWVSNHSPLKSLKF